MKVILNNQVALITGSSRGLGRAIALQLADAGAMVIINYRSSSEEDGYITGQTLNVNGGWYMSS